MSETPATGPKPKTRIFMVVVDDSPELKVALRYASLRARKSGGRVALLYVVEPVAMDSLMSFDRLLRDEQRAEAEQKLQRLAREVATLAGSLPCLIIREGDRRDELLSLLENDANVSVLVLGAGVGKEGPGPLISFLTNRAVSRLHVPLTIVPGSMTDAELEAIT
jgi:nucleotide-binding universal stress UspA family protein